MGHILSYLQSRPPSDLLIDFTNAKPNTTKSDTYEALKKEMVRGYKLLQSLKDYKDGGKSVRRRLLGCKDEEEKPKIFLELLPFVNQVKEYYAFAGVLGKLVPGVAKELINAPDLEHQQAMLKLFADVLDFIRKFDISKQYTPELQMDFAFYKRSIGKFGKIPEVADKIPLTAQEASMISLFLGWAGPLTSNLGDTLCKQFPDDGSSRDQLISLLANMANILCTFIMKVPDASPDSKMYCLGAMTGAIVMYDYVSASSVPQRSVFGRDSKIDIKQCCKQIRGHKDLCACIRYSTKTYAKHASDKIKKYIQG